MEDSIAMDTPENDYYKSQSIVLCVCIEIIHIILSLCIHSSHFIGEFFIGFQCPILGRAKESKRYIVRHHV